MSSRIRRTIAARPRRAARARVHPRSRAPPCRRRSAGRSRDHEDVAVERDVADLGMADRLVARDVLRDGPLVPQRREARARIAQLRDERGHLRVVRVPRGRGVEPGDELELEPLLVLGAAHDPRRRAAEVAPRDVPLQRVAEQRHGERVRGDDAPRGVGRRSPPCRPAGRARAGRRASDAGAAGRTAARCARRRGTGARARRRSAAARGRAARGRTPTDAARGPARAGRGSRPTRPRGWRPPRAAGPARAACRPRGGRRRRAPGGRARCAGRRRARPRHR